MLAKIGSRIPKLNKMDFNSLRVRLTLGIALLSSLGLGSVAVWMSFRMEHLLLMTHVETVESVARTFPHDVEIYSEMVSTEEGIQKTIKNISNRKNLFWFEDDENKIVAHSPYFSAELAANHEISAIPKLVFLDDEYWLMCGIEVDINKEYMGNLYIAQNVTNEQILFTYLIRSLTVTTTVAVTIMLIAIAYYISYSLKPLENMLTRLGQSWDSQKQLLSDVSHELRTPLTIVSGYIQSTLRRGNNLTSVQQEALSVASSEADRTIKLLEDLLALARADNGAVHMNFEEVVVNDFMREIIAMADQYSTRVINLSEEKSNLKLKVDRDRFKQICINLIDNAIKYSPEETQIDIKIKTENSEVKIEFIDRGYGIPLAQQHRIFERFYRVDEARNRAGGTGLGLAIVKTLVNGMNGEITVASNPDQGSIFTLEFPLYR